MMSSNVSDESQRSLLSWPNPAFIENGTVSVESYQNSSGPDISRNSEPVLSPASRKRIEYFKRVSIKVKEFVESRIRRQRLDRQNGRELVLFFVCLMFGSMLVFGHFKAERPGLVDCTCPPPSLVTVQGDPPHEETYIPVTGPLPLIAVVTPESPRTNAFSTTPAITVGTAELANIMQHLGADLVATMVNVTDWQRRLNKYRAELTMHGQVWVGLPYYINMYLNKMVSEGTIFEPPNRPSSNMTSTICLSPGSVTSCDGITINEPERFGCVAIYNQIFLYSRQLDSHDSDFAQNPQRWMLVPPAIADILKRARTLEEVYSQISVWSVFSDWLKVQHNAYHSSNDGCQYTTIQWPPERIEICENVILFQEKYNSCVAVDGKPIFYSEFTDL
jgi:hypothetical protein